MKQPIITRDIERKAIYSDIIYDPEWTYVEVTITEPDCLYSLYVGDCDYDIVIDWGDGNIEKDVTHHVYKLQGIYTIRIKGEISCFQSDEEYGLFNNGFPIKAISYGTKFNANFSLFKSCSSLYEISPSFFVQRQDLTDLHSMFEQCRSLQDIPEGLFDPLVNLTNVSRMFYGCHKLSKLPKRMFSKCTRITQANCLFALCGGLCDVPEDLFDNLDELQSLNATFFGSGVKQIWKQWFKNKHLLTDISLCFDSCANISSVPDGLFEDCPNLYKVSHLFANSNLMSNPEEDHIPSNLFSKSPKIRETEEIFYGTNVSTDKQNEILSNIGSYYKNK